MVHIVDDLGADPNGNSPIDGIVEDAVGDGVTVEFPSDGEFLVGGTISLNANNWELRGNGCRLVQSGSGILSTRGNGYTVDGFEVDVSQTSSQTNIGCHGSGYTFRRMIFRGYINDGGDTYKVFNVHCRDPGGATFEGIYFPDQPHSDDEGYGTGHFLAAHGWNTEGGLTFRNCLMRGGGSTSWYMSEAKSRVIADSCYFHNTMNGPRIFNGELHNCTVVLDDAMPTKLGRAGGWMAGAWIDGAKARISGMGNNPILIDNCDMHFTELAAENVMTDGIIGINDSRGIPGPTTVRNTRIHNDSNNPTINLYSPDNYDISIEGVEVSGPNASDVHLSGSVVSQDWTEVSGEAADPSLPTIPPYGEVPDAEGGTIGCEGDSDCGDGRVCQDGDCVVDPSLNTIELTGSGTATNYEFTVDGPLVIDEATAATHDTVEGQTGTGWVTTNSHTDRFYFGGTVTDFRYLQGGPVAITVNGETFDESSVIGEPTVDPCDGVDCPSGQFCDNGQCVECVENNNDCDDGFVCDSGECVPVPGPCDDVSCGPGEVCENGDCIVVDPCAGVTCGDGEVCQDGTCVEVDPCAGVDCPEGQVCADGECTDGDPGIQTSTLLLLGGLVGLGYAARKGLFGDEE